MKAIVIVLALLATPAAADTVTLFSGSVTIDQVDPVQGTVDVQIGDLILPTAHIVRIATLTIPSAIPTPFIWYLRAETIPGTSTFEFPFNTTETFAFQGDVPTDFLLPLPLVNYTTPFLTVIGGAFLPGIVDSLTQIDATHFIFSGHNIPAAPEPSTWALLLFGFAFFAIKGIWPARERIRR